MEMYYEKNFVRSSSHSHADEGNLLDNKNVTDRVTSRASSESKEVRQFYEEVVGNNDVEEKERRTVSSPCNASKDSLSRARHRRNSNGKRPTDLTSFSLRKKHKLVSDLFKIITEGRLDALEEMVDLYGKEVLLLRDDFSWTSLMSASQAGQSNLVDYILSNVENGYTILDGKSAEDIAVRSYKLDVISVFFKHRHGSLIENNTVQMNGQLHNNTEEVCETCHVTVAEKAKHETSTAHVFLRNKDRRPSRGVQLPGGSIGYRMMLRQGWESNAGLGKNKDGRMQPIATEFKRNRTGLGMEKLPKRITHSQEVTGGGMSLSEKQPRIQRVKLNRLQQNKTKARLRNLERQFRQSFHEEM